MKVMAGLSGGVDSSVAALLLHRQGIDTSGLFMKNWEEDDRMGSCPAAADAKDAAAVAASLGIPFHTRNFAAEYWDHVFEHFLAEYQVGRTPNPDILCNREIKFKTFLEHAEDLGCSHIATGHYARRDELDGRYRLLRGLDQNKDQSYFLYTLGQQQLARTLFPVGELEKPAVRELAASAGFLIHDKKDSTGICFIGERNFRPFLSRYLPAQPGEIRTQDGQLVGQHQGLMYYTLGQRQGLGIGGVKGAGDAPWYVLSKNMQDNILIVGQGHDHPLLFSNRLEISELSWVAGIPAEINADCTAKIRYRQADQACQISQIEKDSCRVVFEQDQWAVTPGQSIVFYRGEECLGGGIIDYSEVTL